MNVASAQVLPDCERALTIAKDGDKAPPVHPGQGRGFDISDGSHGDVF
jgi:hypothetical protein